MTAEEKYKKNLQLQRNLTAKQIRLERKIESLKTEICDVKMELTHVANRMIPNERTATIREDSQNEHQ